MGSKLLTCNFEVFGRVQGVFFRKYTQEKAQALELTGWCMNTYDDTVKGEIEGPQPKLEEMKHWLSNTGSPQSKIEKAVFSPYEEISARKHPKFKIVR